MSKQSTVLELTKAKNDRATARRSSDGEEIGGDEGVKKIQFGICLVPVEMTNTGKEGRGVSDSNGRARRKESRRGEEGRVYTAEGTMVVDDEADAMGVDEVEGMEIDIVDRKSVV